MQLNKSLDLSTLQEHIPMALVDLSTFDYIQLFYQYNYKIRCTFQGFCAT